MGKLIVLFIITYTNLSFGAEKDKFKDTSTVKTINPTQIIVCSCNTESKTDWKVANALR